MQARDRVSTAWLRSSSKPHGGRPVVFARLKRLASPRPLLPHHIKGRQAEGVALTERDLTQMVQLIEGLDGVGMPSMAQDRIAHRKTEVEEFSGTICRLARKHDIEVPQNEWLYERIRAIESTW